MIEIGRALNIEDLLMRYTLVTPEELASSKIEAMENGRDLKDVLIERGAVSEDALLYAVSSELDIPFVTLEPNSIDRDLFRTLPVEVLKRYRFLPLIEVEGELRIAVADPTDSEVIGFIEKTFPERMLNFSAALASNIIETIDAISSEGEEEGGGIKEPAIAVFYSFLTAAVGRGATALYFEPAGKRLRIRMRVKNKLKNSGDEPVEFLMPIIQRISSMVNIGDRPSGSIKTRISGRDVIIKARIIRDGERPGGILLFTYTDRKESINRLNIDEETLNRINAALWTGNGCILIAGHDSTLSGLVVRSLVTQINPARRRVVALLQEEFALEDVEYHVFEEAEEINRSVSLLFDSDTDAVYIQNLRREGLNLHNIFRLAETSTVIATVPVNNAKDAIHYIEARTPDTEKECRPIALVIEALKEPLPCPHCSRMHWNVGRGCRRCGYTGISGYSEKINVLRY